MRTLVECVPNFSEGRDRGKVEQIAAAIETVPGVYLLDVHLDPDHHRSVITFAGSKETVGEAAVRAVGRAADWIDLNQQEGEHPRIGAADVVPFVPMEGVTLEDCVAIAHQAGEKIFRRFQIPVYFYEAAALRPERRRLEHVRRAGYERLKRLVLEDPALQPDVGEPRLHPTAGATIVGARPFLIAFNVNLNSSDRKVAQEIARRVRSSGGGLPGVKAIGLLLKSRSVGGQPGRAQVAMNLTDFERTSLAEAFHAVEQEALRLGVSIQSSELVGLIPQKALAGTSPEALKLVDFHPGKILETRLATVLAHR